MIAMALSCQPTLLIADEPTTALDVTTQAQILELMRQLQQEDGMAIMLITHDLGVVAEMANDVVVMYLGRVVEQGPVRRDLPRPAAPLHAGAAALHPPHPGARARAADADRGHGARSLRPADAAAPSTRAARSSWPGGAIARRRRSKPVGDRHAVSCFLYE